MRHPDAVVGLLKAVLVHDLTDASPRGAWLFLPCHDDENGIERWQVHGVTVRLTGLDRTVIDLWRFPRRIPEEFALEALRRRAKMDSFRVPDFARMARRLGAWGHLELVVQGLMLR